MLFNKARAGAYMQAAGVDALLATSPVSITYFTDYSCWIDPLMKEYMMAPGASSNTGEAYAIYPNKGDPALVCSSALMAVNAIDLWVKDLRCYGATGTDVSIPAGDWGSDEARIMESVASAPKNSSASHALRAALKDRNMTSTTVGIEMEGLPGHRYQALCAALPHVTWKDCSNLLRVIRSVKTEDEIQRLSRAAEINESAALGAFQLAKPGESIRNCINHFRQRVGEMGADMDHFAFGYRGMGIATEPDLILSDSFVEYVDWGCVYRQCYSDTGTTLAMAPLSKELHWRYQALRSCMDDSAALIQPGMKASAVRAPMQAAIERFGLKDMYPHGHGLGLEVRGYPIIVPDNGLFIKDDCLDVPSDLPLEENMVINLEAPLFMPGVGSLHIEESYVVTSNGYRELIPQARRQPVIPHM
jgi:Xaa-Pro dipeptidase